MAPDFTSSDAIARHLLAIEPSLGDQVLANKYVGFGSVSAAAIFEMNIKDAIFEFCGRISPVFENFGRSRFERMNGRISIKLLKEDCLLPFGEAYKDGFVSRLDSADQLALATSRTSVIQCYQNLLTWRHSFAHTGSAPATATLSEFGVAYEESKKVIQCFFEVLA
jgi:hypothetical protein